MKINWNPWHGCNKVSSGCDNCLLYQKDSSYGKDASQIYKVRDKFDYPLQKYKTGKWKIPSGSEISVCVSSDFFLEEADAWRGDAWGMIRERKDLLFIIETKRASRVVENLPADWGFGYENVCITVSVEDQATADERVPALLGLPALMKGIVVSPILGEVNLVKYLSTGEIKSVSVGGESGIRGRVCNYDWVVSLHEQCATYGVNFNFSQTGSTFLRGGKEYKISMLKEADQAERSGLNSRPGRPWDAMQMF